MSRRRRGEQRVARSDRLPRGPVERIQVSVPPEEVAASARSAHEHSVRNGARFNTATTKRHGELAVQRFERWLDSLGVDGGLETVLVPLVGRIKGRVLPQDWLVKYAAALVDPGIAVTSWRIAVSNFTAGLEHRGVEAEGWPHRPTPELAARLDGIAEQAGMEERPDRPALPIFADDASAIDAAIEQHQHPRAGREVLAVQRAALRVFNSVGFWAWARSGEMVEHLRWGDLPEFLAPGEGWAVTWRSGKWQPFPVTLRRGASLDPDPVAAVAELRAALAVLGLHPTKKDALLPGLVDGKVVLNPVDQLDIDRDGAIAARGLARERATDWYRTYWRKAAERAGLRATRSRRLAPHGLRRGPATALAMANAPLEQIRFELRHTGHSFVTVLYCDEQQIDMSEVAALLDEVDATDAGASPSDLLDLVAKTASPRGVDHSLDDAAEPRERCWVKDCGGAFKWRRMIHDDLRVRLCQEHARSHALGAGDWTELAACSGLRCDQPAVQRLVGELSGPLCARCWRAATKVKDPTDRETWARPGRPLCELCTDRVIPSVKRIGASRTHACSRHVNRWKHAGSPELLGDDLRSTMQPVHRAGDSPCAWCDDPERPARRWVRTSMSGDVAVCEPHAERWARAGKPEPVPVDVAKPIRHNRRS